MADLQGITTKESVNINTHAHTHTNRQTTEYNELTEVNYLNH